MSTEKITFVVEDAVSCIKVAMLSGNGTHWPTSKCVSSLSALAIASSTALILAVSSLAVVEEPHHALQTQQDWTLQGLD